MTKILSMLFLLGSLPVVAAEVRDSSLTEKNETMLQYFHWDLPDDGTLWRQVTRESTALSESGITELWLPPSTKGASGTADVGYGVYDHYDLGEFPQKGAIRTKYGTKSEYVEAIEAAHSVGLKIISDAVMNHLAGADYQEKGGAFEINLYNRNEKISGEEQISAWTGFNFPGRAGKYSSFTWNWDHFTGVDFAANLPKNGIFLLDRGARTGWSPDVDTENGNYDYLLLNDLDLEHPDVRRELITWGKWNLTDIGVDGFRLDAVKHMSLNFTAEWAKAMEDTYPGVRIVGEYWSYDMPKLQRYIQKTYGLISLFDFPLQSHFQNAAQMRGFYDLGQLFNGTWTATDPRHSVTFVDNHDTWRDHAVNNFVVPDSFKPMAYAVILLRAGGIPSVFLKDWTGLFSEVIRKLVKVRSENAYGDEHAYFDDQDIVGWTREGTALHPGALAVVITDSFWGAGTHLKKMFVGNRPDAPADRTFHEALGNILETVHVGADGIGNFPVRAASDVSPAQAMSVWVEDL